MPNKEADRFTSTFYFALFVITVGGAGLEPATLTLST